MTGVYTSREVNLMERSFLGLIGYELWVAVEEIKEFLDEYGEKIEMEVRDVEIEQGCRWWIEECQWTTA